MKTAKRGYGNPRTLRSKVDRIKARTPQYRFIEPAGSSPIPSPDAAVPKAHDMEATAPDVHEVTVRY